VVSVAADRSGGVTRPPRLALLVFGTARFDSRTWRVARSALRAGYQVVVYARWEPGLPRDAVEDGIRIVRVAVPARQLVLRPISRVALRIPRLRPSRARPTTRPGPALGSVPVHSASSASTPDLGRGDAGTPRARFGSIRQWLRFPHSILPWAAALDRVVEPADLWHGRLVGGLPAAVRQARRLGGAAIYDSGDVYVQSRELAQGGLYARLVARAERGWARRCAAVLTVNEPFARLLERQLRVPPPTVVMNCPERYEVPEPRPDLIRKALGLAPSTRVALYQGGLMTGRGVEQAMDAVLQVRDTVLAILGFGASRGEIVRRAASPRYEGRVHVLQPVSPAALLDWSASADVAVMPIQDTSANHRYATPNKLFEAIAAGTPVVASDLPGMSTIVRPAGAGVLVDPFDPGDIARGLREVLDAVPEDREQMRQRCLAAARDRFNWEAQEGALLAVYRRLLETVMRR